MTTAPSSTGTTRPKNGATHRSTKGSEDELRFHNGNSQSPPRQPQERKRNRRCRAASSFLAVTTTLLVATTTRRPTVRLVAVAAATASASDMTSHGTTSATTTSSSLKGIPPPPPPLPRFSSSLSSMDSKDPPPPPPPPPPRRKVGTLSGQVSGASDKNDAIHTKGDKNGGDVTQNDNINSDSVQEEDKQIKTPPRPPTLRKASTWQGLRPPPPLQTSNENGRTDALNGKSTNTETNVYHHQEEDNEPDIIITGNNTVSRVDHHANASAKRVPIDPSVIRIQGHDDDVVMQDSFPELDDPPSLETIEVGTTAAIKVGGNFNHVTNLDGNDAAMVSTKTDSICDQGTFHDTDTASSSLPSSSSSLLSSNERYIGSNEEHKPAIQDWTRPNSDLTSPDYALPLPQRFRRADAANEVPPPPPPSPPPPIRKKGLERAQQSPYYQLPPQRHPQTTTTTFQNPTSRQGQEYRQPLPPAIQSSRRIGIEVSSTFKNIWGSVERGLDKLATLEESVTDRAQSLASNVAQGLKSTASSVVAGGEMNSHQQEGDINSTFNERRTWRSLQRQKRNENVPEPTREALRPYGQKYQVARDKNQQDSEEKDIRINSSDTTSHMTMLLSKGGALSPSDASALGTGTSASTPSMPLVTDRSFASRSSDNPLLSTSASMLQPQQPPRPPPPPPRQSLPYQGDPFRPYGGRPTQNGYPDTFMSQKQQQQQQTGTKAASRLPWDPNMKSTGTPSFSTSAFSGPKQRRPNPPPPPPTPISFDDVYSESSSPFWKRVLRALVPPMPPNPLKLFRKKDKYQYASLDAWKVDDEDEDGQERHGGFLGLFRGSKNEKERSSTFSSSRSSKVPDSGILAIMPLPISNMLARSNNCESTVLLTQSEKNKCRQIGRCHALTDVGILILVMLGVQQIAGLEHVVPLPTSLEDFWLVLLPSLSSILKEAIVTTWAPFALLYAFLLNYIRQAILEPWTNSQSLSVSTSVRHDTEYAQLYMLLVAATPVDASLPERLATTGRQQVTSLVSKERLSSYVTMLLTAFAIMTVSVARPMAISFASTIYQIFLLKEWQSWPVPWGALWAQIQSLFQGLHAAMESQGQAALSYISEHPMNFMVPLIVGFSLTISALLPQFEEKRSIASHCAMYDEVDDDDEVLSMMDKGSGEDLVRLGSSSASRLSMLSDNGSMESVFERWYGNRLSTSDETSNTNNLAIGSILRLIGYVLAGILLASAPILASFIVEGSSAFEPFHHALLPHLESSFNLSILQLYLFVLLFQALRNVIESTEKTSLVKRFLDDLSTSRDEIKESNKRETNLQAMASISPSAGLAVRDLWAAHTTKRIWAVRGATFECRNGEVVAVLGEDGDGKSRLLTAVAEAVAFPPERSMTTNKVRGKVSVGGVEASKWDRHSLKRRLGILLSDVGVVSDWASLFSGWTLGEILQPVDGVRVSNARGDKPAFINQQHKLTPSEKESILLALKITGLYATLQSKKLPSNLATVLTCNEEDFKSSSINPRATLLSPGEWSKVLLARVLAQRIHDNDNVLASNSGSTGDKSLENSLIGSVLLLDDLTVWMSEVEEAKLLKDLRQTGAATIFSSNKWSTGRFADRICVVKDGAIVETGTHNELIARGPQQSLYAAKWHLMSMV